MKNTRSLVPSIAIVVVIFVIGFLGIIGFDVASNKQLFDVTFSFERAVIYLPNGKTIEGRVEGWTDFEDGDQIQVKIDGKTYLTHSTNVVLISD